MYTLAVALITVLVLVIPLCLYRLITILDPKRLRPGSKLDHGRDGRSAHLLIVLGSGGHTAEMLAMLERAIAERDGSRRLDLANFKYRTWVVSSGDELSARRARIFEDEVSSLSLSSTHLDGAASNTDTGISPLPEEDVQVLTVPRARRIHQPLFTAPMSSLQCLFACLSLLTQCSNPERDFPDIILCNGPATATILVLASVLLRFFDVRACQSRGKMRTVYVESWARVRKLSLSGRLLEWVVDRFLVQWPQLRGEGRGDGRRREYMGVFV